MDLDRRLMLGGMGLAAGALAHVAGARPVAAEVAALVSGRSEDQSAALQAAVDAAAGSGGAVILPAGRFVIGGVVLRPRTALAGSGRTILQSNGEVLLSAEDADGIAIDGLVLEGGRVSFARCRNVTFRHCDLTGANGGLGIEGGSDHIVTANRFAGIEGTAVSLSRGAEGAILSHNLIDGAGAGLLATGLDGGTRLAVIQGNLVRNIGRESGTAERPGCGIVAEADAVISGNVVEGAALCGILAGMGGAKRDVTIIGNLLRECATGIGLSGDPQGGLIFVSQNMITGARTGAIRAMDGMKPIGPDLTRASAEAYPNLAILQNVATR